MVLNIKNYKTIIEVIVYNKNRYIMLMAQNNQLKSPSYSEQSEDLKQNPIYILHRHKQTNSKIHMRSQKSINQSNFEKE